MTETEKAELKNRFQTDGFALIRRLFTPQEVAKLNAEVLTAQKSFDSTLDRSGLVFREYLFYRSEYLRSVITSPKVLEIMTQIIGPDLWVRRDTSIIKNPGGEEFPWHQDNGYNQLLDPYVQFWVAITPMSDANGGAWLVPGSHKNGLLPHYMKSTHAVWSGGRPENPIAVEAEAGDVLVFSSYILHRTGPNRTEKDRVAYLVEFMDRKYFDPYTKSPFFMVSKAGKPEGKFTRFYEGNTNPANLLKYVGPRTARRVRILRGQLRQALFPKAK